MTLLHRAVIENDMKSLKDQQFVEKWLSVPDNYGFTALEIAQFLGKNEALKLLGGSLPTSFKLQSNGLKEPLELSLEAFEKALGIHYRPYLTFPSYSFFKEVVSQCPYILRSHWLASDNYKWTHTYKNEVVSGKIGPLYIKWIDSTLGYGVFAEEGIPYGAFVGEYSGLVRRLYRRHSDQNPYCFHYPTKFWSLKYYIIDSFKEGNLTRFINHSHHPNLEPICLVDRGLLHQVFIASRPIRKGEQLTFDYGKDFWEKRNPVKN